MKIAVFGSAFNPPTLGHLDAIQFVLNDADHFDNVFLIPSYQHAFAKAMLDYSHRVALLEKFVSDIGDPRVIAMPVEHRIAQPDKPVYTFDVLSYLSDTDYGSDQLTFVMGPDNKANWHKFYKADEVEARWGTKVVPERMPVRSTKVRKAIKQQASVKDMLTPSVEAYIREHGLYV